MKSHCLGRARIFILGLRRITSGWTDSRTHICNQRWHACGRVVRMCLGARRGDPRWADQGVQSSLASTGFREHPGLIRGMNKVKLTRHNTTCRIPHRAAAATPARRQGEIAPCTRCNAGSRTRRRGLHPQPNKTHNGYCRLLHSDGDFGAPRLVCHSRG